MIGFDISFLQTQCKRHNLKQNEAQSACAESANKGVNKLSKDVTQTQQQRPELLTVTLTWRASKYKVHKFHQSYIHFGSVHVLLVDSMYLVFTRMPGLSYHRRLRSLLLCLCDVFRALLSFLVCWHCISDYVMGLQKLTVTWQLSVGAEMAVSL